MGSSRARIESDTGPFPVQTFQNLIIGDGGLSVFGVYHLPWAVKWIQAKREVDRTFVLWDNTLEQCDITFPDQAVLELGLQVLVYTLGLGNEH